MHDNPSPLLLVAWGVGIYLVWLTLWVGLFAVVAREARRMASVTVVLLLIASVLEAATDIHGLLSIGATWDEGPVARAITGLVHNIGLGCLVLGLLTLVGRCPARVAQAAPKSPLVQRSAPGTFLACTLLGVFYYPFWLYRTVKDIRDSFPEDVGFTPGAAVGYCFIPIFNIYWAIKVIVAIPASIGRIERKCFAQGTAGFALHPAVISALLIASQVVMGLSYGFLQAGTLTFTLLETGTRTVRSSVTPTDILPVVIGAYLLQGILLAIIQSKLNALHSHMRASGEDPAVLQPA